MRGKTDKKDKPLTRADVESRLREVGSSTQLNLKGLNLKGINLANFNLVGAHLEEAHLEEANLQGAHLEEAHLEEADLFRARMKGANLTGAYLQGAYLEGAHLEKANLRRAHLEEADLRWANLEGVHLQGAYLQRAHLQEAHLEKSDLRWANLQGANLQGADLTGANLAGALLERTHLLGVIGLDTGNKEAVDNTATLRISITEEPLTAQNFTSIMSAFTELHTKSWIIAQNRFANLIEYTQTHNSYFAEEAHLVISQLTHNSPAEIAFNLDFSPQGVAEGLVELLDGITQARQRLEKAELENRAKRQEIEHTAQKADQESQMAMLEKERQELAIERERLELLDQRLELQKKGIEYALEIAGKLIDTLQPGVDQATKAMAIQALLPNVLQLQNGKGLELALPAPQISGEKTVTTEKERANGE